MANYELGKMNKLEVIKQLDFGVYVLAGDAEILIPKRYVPEGTEIGQFLDVFIYRDSEDRIIATSLVPKVMVDDYALLEVLETNKFGVFVDWGLPKDLFVPFQEQNGRMAVGKLYVIRPYIDPETDRIVGSARIERFLVKDTSQLQTGQAVAILPFKYTDLGMKCIVNNQYEGMLFKNMVYGTIKLGEKYNAFIKEIRNDGKIDLSLKTNPKEHLSQLQINILERLKAQKGFIGLHDKSTPEAIFTVFSVSKRDFKQAVGGLYKSNKITINDNGLQLV
jgi:uncharacterized protein